VAVYLAKEWRTPKHGMAAPGSNYEQYSLWSQSFKV
jgi:hypothetical protein